ncbi:hypothetical protein MAPG_06510 [Magnaporthiopsis poae ATCC 64411]|uniref:Uncharacterized protein n=1 Tax=Magnaporthiopsis poae (strain ATCC 64411 / 73-15) TaxID=644358 RepID=A0A0C4E281_MAGP6|nr:hypothetical protein MAPG_06510 [Magnaporthiopsis poae ATCC 64411]
MPIDSCVIPSLSYRLLRCRGAGVGQEKRCWTEAAAVVFIVMLLLLLLFCLFAARPTEHTLGAGASKTLVTLSGHSRGTLHSLCLALSLLKVGVACAFTAAERAMCKTKPMLSPHFVPPWLTFTLVSPQRNTARGRPSLLRRASVPKYLLLLPGMPGQSTDLAIWGSWSSARATSAVRRSDLDAVLPAPSVSEWAKAANKITNVPTLGPPGSRLAGKRRCVCVDLGLMQDWGNREKSFISSGYSRPLFFFFLLGWAFISPPAVISKSKAIVWASDAAAHALASRTLAMGRMQATSTAFGLSCTPTP